MNKLYSSGLIEFFFNLANQTVEPPNSIVEVGYEVVCLPHPPFQSPFQSKVDFGDEIAGMPKIRLVTNLIKNKFN